MRSFGMRLLHLDCESGPSVSSCCLLRASPLLPRLAALRALLEGNSLRDAGRVAVFWNGVSGPLHAVFWNRVSGSLCAVFLEYVLKVASSSLVGSVQWGNSAKVC